MALRFCLVQGTSIDLRVAGSSLLFNWPFNWEVDDNENELFHKESYWPSATSCRSLCLNHVAYIPTPLPSGFRWNPGSAAPLAFVLPPTFEQPDEFITFRGTLRGDDFVQYAGTASNGDQWIIDVGNFEHSVERTNRYSDWQFSAYPGKIRIEVFASAGQGAYLVRLNGPFDDLVPRKQLPDVPLTLILRPSSLVDPVSTRPGISLAYPPTDEVPCNNEFGSRWLIGSDAGVELSRTEYLDLYRGQFPSLWSITPAVEPNKLLISIVGTTSQPSNPSLLPTTWGFRRILCTTVSEFPIGTKFLCRYRVAGLGCVRVVRPTGISYFNGRAWISESSSSIFPWTIGVEQISNAAGLALYRVFTNSGITFFTTANFASEGGQINFDFEYEVVSLDEMLNEAFVEYRLTFQPGGQVILSSDPSVRGGIAEFGIQHRPFQTPLTLEQSSAFSERLQDVVIDANGNIELSPTITFERQSIERIPPVIPPG